MTPKQKMLYSEPSNRDTGHLVAFLDSGNLLVIMKGNLNLKNTDFIPKNPRQGRSELRSTITGTTSQTPAGETCQGKYQERLHQATYLGVLAFQHKQLQETLLGCICLVALEAITGVDQRGKVAVNTLARLKILLFLQLLHIQEGFA